MFAFIITMDFEMSPQKQTHSDHRIMDLLVDKDVCSTQFLLGCFKLNCGISALSHKITSRGYLTGVLNWQLSRAKRGHISVLYSLKLLTYFYSLWFQNQPSVTSLDIEDNYMGPPGMLCFAEMLKSNSYITEAVRAGETDSTPVPFAGGGGGGGGGVRDEGAGV